MSNLTQNCYCQFWAPQFFSSFKSKSTWQPGEGNRRGRPSYFAGMSIPVWRRRGSLSPALDAPTRAWSLHPWWAFVAMPWVVVGFWWLPRRGRLDAYYRPWQGSSRSISTTFWKTLMDRSPRGAMNPLDTDKVWGDITNWRAHHTHMVGTTGMG